MRAKAIDQWTRELPIYPKRGEIVDCNGVLLAGNNASYSVYVRPRCVTDAKAVSATLADIFEIDEGELYKKIVGQVSSEITVARQVDKTVIANLEKHLLNGVYYSIDNSRVYPYGDVLCQTLGYTSSDGLGICGLEMYYENYLKGTKGEILYEADLVGKDISSNAHFIPATDGLSVKLSIDINIQIICETALQRACLLNKPKSASILVLNPQNGEIIAIANKPSFDLNSPPRDNIEELNLLSRNTVIVDSYEPGSTFKVVTALANIEEGLNNNSSALGLNYVFPSSNYRIVDGKKIKCWTTHANGKHSNETLSEALNNSCNPCFVDIALSLGKNTFYKYVENLNFGSTTGVDFSGEALGMVVPVSAVTNGDLARISFGQTIACTPLQLASAVCAAVNGGNYYVPHLISEIYDKKSNVKEVYKPILKRKVASKQASEILSGYLERVVSEGSGKNAFIEGYKIGGKTGTAQKYENGKIAQGKNIMSFVGFFPSDKPRYLALAIVDEPTVGDYGSTVSAPIVKEVFQGIIDYKNISKFQ